MFGRKKKKHIIPMVPKTTYRVSISKYFETIGGFETDDYEIAHDLDHIDKIVADGCVVKVHEYHGDKYIKTTTYGEKNFHPAPEKPRLRLSSHEYAEMILRQLGVPESEWNKPRRKKYKFTDDIAIDQTDDLTLDEYVHETLIDYTTR